VSQRAGSRSAPWGLRGLSGTHDGQAYAAANGYMPLPPQIRALAAGVAAKSGPLPEREDADGGQRSGL